MNLDNFKQSYISQRQTPFFGGPPRDRLRDKGIQNFVVISAIFINLLNKVAFKRFLTCTWIYSNPLRGSTHK